MIDTIALHSFLEQDPPFLKHPQQSNIWLFLTLTSNLVLSVQMSGLANHCFPQDTLSPPTSAKKQFIWCALFNWLEWKWAGAWELFGSVGNGLVVWVDSSQAPACFCSSKFNLSYIYLVLVNNLPETLTFSFCFLINTANNCCHLKSFDMLKIHLFYLLIYYHRIHEMQVLVWGFAKL